MLARMATAAERYAAVNALIDAIIAGGGVSRYTIGGDEVQLAELSDLFKLQAELAPQAQAESGGGSRISLAVLRPRK